MNSYHLNIYYTSNRENQNKILRLCFPISRSDGKFTLSKSPQKKIRGFYIHFDSVYLEIIKRTYSSFFTFKIYDLFWIFSFENSFYKISLEE